MSENRAARRKHEKAACHNHLEIVIQICLFVSYNTNLKETS
jgi:hypothetical protein